MTTKEMNDKEVNKDVNSTKIEITNFNYREREQWSNKFEFILSCMAFSIGLGNVWRFPYLCFKNGGGAFLIPYIICLFGGGVPMYFLEVALGQYWQNGGITVWDLVCPLFKGIGYGTAIINFILNVYYIVILSWALVYLYYSFNLVLPWSVCGNEWNTENCWSPKNIYDSVNRTKDTKLTDSAIEFWENKILQITSGIDEPGGFQPYLVLSLAIMWILCFFCIWRGIRSTGKAVYVTAIFPYIMLTILFIRGITLPGALDGIKFYLQPDFNPLLEVDVWIDAGTQIFFSYAIALGTMTALGSYNKFHNNFYHQLFFITAMNSGTSLYAGFAIFSVLGFMAHEQKLEVSDVAEKGPGLAFVAYPKGVSVMPYAPIWAILFFIMIILLGLGSQFVAVEGLVTAIVDSFPGYLRINKRREYFIACICLVSFCMGLPMVTRGGMYLFQLYDYYGASGMCLLWMSFFESVVVAWIYGADRFCDNIKEMIGFRPSCYFIFVWKYFTPFLTSAIFISSIYILKPIKYNDVYEYPDWAIGFGWFLALSSMICVPIYLIYKLCTTPAKNLKQKLKILTQASPSPYLQRQQELMQIQEINKAEQLALSPKETELILVPTTQETTNAPPSPPLQKQATLNQTIAAKETAKAPPSPPLQKQAALNQTIAAKETAKAPPSPPLQKQAALNQTKAAKETAKAPPSPPLQKQAALNQTKAAKETAKAPPSPPIQKQAALNQTKAAKETAKAPPSPPLKKQNELNQSALSKDISNVESSILSRESESILSKSSKEVSKIQPSSLSKQSESTSSKFPKEISKIQPSTLSKQSESTSSKFPKEISKIQPSTLSKQSEEISSKFPKEISKIQPSTLSKQSEEIPSKVTKATAKTPPSSPSQKDSELIHSKDLSKIQTSSLFQKDSESIQSSKSTKDLSKMQPSSLQIHSELSPSKDKDKKPELMQQNKSTQPKASKESKDSKSDASKSHFASSSL